MLPSALPRVPVAAVLALALLVALVSSDFYARRFWTDHPATTGILAALAVVLISVTVIEVVVKRRAERRWRLLAQYALMELAEAAQDAWRVLAVVFHDDDSRSDRAADSGRITEILDSRERAPLLKRNLDATLAESSKRDALQRSLEETLDNSRELISRWAVVLTGSSKYSELFDRHVEMIGRIHGLWYFLAYGARRGSQSANREGLIVMTGS